MRRLSAIALLMLVFAGMAWSADPPTLQIDRDTLYEGEAVTLTVRIPGAGIEYTPDLSALPDIQTQLLDKRSESRHQVFIENGRVRREGFSGTVYFFALRPLRVGDYPEVPFTLNVDGRVHSLTFPRLTVLPIPPQEGVRLDLLSDREEALPDEAFTVTLRLRVRRLAPPYADVVPFLPQNPPLLSLPHLTGKPIEGLEGPDIRAVLQGWRQQGTPGVLIESAPENNDPFNMSSFFNMGDSFGGGRSVYLPPHQAVDVDGQPYMEFLFPVTFTAREEGTYTFGPATLKGSVLTGVDQHRRGLTRDLYAVARALTVSVVPPPVEGRPASYFGLSGTNLTADAQISASECRVGDPLKLTLSVRGPLHWQRAGAPDLGTITNLTSRFRIYGSTMQTLKAGDGRDYTFTLRPLQPGTEEIPPLPVSWYDTGANAYRTVYTAPIPLKVEPSAELTMGSWADPKPDDDPERQASSVSKSPAALRFQPPAPERVPPLWFGWLALGPLLLGLRLLGRRLLRLRAGRRQAARPRRALALALAALKRIPTGDPRRTAEAASQALRTFAADRLNREPGGLTPPDWIRLLQEQGVPAETAREFGDVMTRLFEAAYSPVPRPEVESEILPGLPALLRKIGQPETRPGSGHSSRALLLLISVVSILGTTARAQNADAHTSDFAWEEAQTLAAKASDTADFKAAATRYGRLAAEGRRDGALFYNMGTCLLLAGEPQPALNALIRAERYWGRPTDLAHNMDLARAALNGGEPVPEPWDRTVLFFHFGLPLFVRIRIALAAFGLFWILWALNWGRVRGLLALILALALLATVIFGTSSLITRYQENQAGSLPSATGAGS